MDRVYGISGRRFRHAVETAASSAGRSARRQAAADAPRRAAEGQVGDGREARPRRCAARAAGGRCGRPTAACRSSTRTHQQCTRRPPGRTSTAPASPTTQTPSAPRSSTSPVAGVQLARLVADEVAEQAERRALRPVAAPRAAAQHVRAALGVQLRDHPRVREQDEHRPAPTAARARAARPRPAGTGRCGRRWSASTAGRGGRSALRVDPRPPVDGRGLGKWLGGSPAGDRAAEDHEVGVERQLVDLPRVPLALA